MTRRTALVFAAAIAVAGGVAATRVTLAAPPASPTPPTFAADVAPIVYSKCAGCHRPGQSAPFSLLSYTDVVRRADVIDQALESGYMPPWRAYQPDGFPALQNDRELTAAEYTTLLSWIDAGAPSGDLASAPKPPDFPKGWPLGTPDVVLSLDRAIDIAADGRDVYRNVTFALDYPDDRWVRAIDYEPSAPGAVHHALFFAAPAGFTVDEHEIIPGLSALRGALAGALLGGRGASVATFSDAWETGLGGWVPGTIPRFLPDGIAQPLPKHANLIAQFHLHPTGKAEHEQGRLAIYFAKTPPAHSLLGVQVPPAFGFGSGIDIPAGATDYTIRDSFTLPVDVEAYGAHGHAHYLCKEIKMTATLPDGSTRGLLWIKPWDFNWQDSYFFQTPFTLPKGTRLDTVLVYDNSTGNIRNPNSPPEEVRWGPQSTDEMGSMTLLVTTDTPGDADLIRANERLQLRQEVITTRFGRGR